MPAETTTRKNFCANALPSCNKRKGHNPELRAFRGVSYKRGGRNRHLRVRDMRAALITE